MYIYICIWKFSTNWLSTNFSFYFIGEKINDIMPTTKYLCLCKYDYISMYIIARHIIYSTYILFIYAYANIFIYYTYNNMRGFRE